MLRMKGSITVECTHSNAFETVEAGLIAAKLSTKKLAQTTQVSGKQQESLFG